MPLEAIQELISTVVDLVDDQPSRSPLLNADGHVFVTKDFFEAVLVNPKAIKDDILGYFSLIMSDIKADWEFGTSGSPKQLTNIMPRTDFTSIYFSQLRSRGPHPDQLYDLVKELTCFKHDCDEIA